MSGTVWLSILIAIGLIIAASNWWLGAWSNLITLVNLVLAGLIATSFFTNVSNTMLRLDPSWVNVVDFVAIWLLFAFSFIALRGITELLSRYRLRFHPVVELVGRSIGALAVGFLFVSFTCYTLLFAPLPISAEMGFRARGVYPELAWGELADRLSTGSLAAHASSKWFGQAVSGGDHRRVGTTGDVGFFGDRLRRRIDRSTNLRTGDNKQE